MKKRTKEKSIVVEASLPADFYIKMAEQLIRDIDECLDDYKKRHPAEAYDVKTVLLNEGKKSFSRRGLPTDVLQCKRQGNTHILVHGNCFNTVIITDEELENMTCAVFTMTVAVPLAEGLVRIYIENKD